MGSGSKFHGGFQLRAELAEPERAVTQRKTGNDSHRAPSLGARCGLSFKNQEIRLAIHTALENLKKTVQFIPSSSGQEEIEY